MNPRLPMADIAYTIARYPNTGLRANVDSTCDATPIPGTMAMYTSGWPKNQNRCCHSSGEPPLCAVCGIPLTTSPPGMKKLVPPSRSSSIRMPAESSTPNASKLRIAVMNQAHTVSGSRIMLSPGARRSITVVIKLIAPISDAAQKNAIEMIHIVWPSPSPGPAIEPSVESGEYAVQPLIGAPPSTKNAAIRQQNEMNVVQNDIMFSVGKAMSAAPI